VLCGGSRIEIDPTKGSRSEKMVTTRNVKTNNIRTGLKKEVGKPRVLKKKKKKTSWAKKSPEKKAIDTE